MANKNGIMIKKIKLPGSEVKLMEFIKRGDQGLLLFKRVRKRCKKKKLS